MPSDVPPAAQDYYAACRNTSNSSLDVFGLCERRYELDKLLPRSNTENVDTRFGHILGDAVQKFFISGKINTAYMSAMQGWKGILDADDAEARKSKKTFWHAINAVNCFQLLRSTRFSGYQVVDFGNGPAAELGFNIDFGGGYYYRGYIDLVLIHLVKRELLVVELKTTKSWNPSDAMYKHSGQALGYSLLLDMIAAKLQLEQKAAWHVVYPIFSTTQFEWIVKEFWKTRLERAKWIKNLMLKHKRVEQNIADQYFPMSSNGCFSFGKECPHFGYCEHENALIMPAGATPVKHEVYEFNFKIEDIIENMLKETV